MDRAATVKRSLGLVLVIAVTGGGLLMATPSSAERSPWPALAEARAATAPTKVQGRPVAATSQTSARSPRPSAQLSGTSFGGARSRRHRADEVDRPGVATDDEPGLEPWSLIAGGLSVMIFIARRRRAD